MIGTSAERLAYLDEQYPVWKDYTIWQFYEQSAARFPENDFLVYADRTFSYEEIRQYAMRISESLIALGVRQGMHVAVRLKNRPEHVCLILALARIGAAKISVNTHASEEELHFILEKAEADYLFTDDLAMQTSSICGERIKTIITFRHEETLDGRVICFDDFLQNAADWKEQWENKDPFVMSDIMFTSGSTSRPKGVVMTHDMVVRSGYATARTRLMETGRRICVPIPLYHAFAYIEGLMSAITIGGALLLSQERYDAERTLQLMRDMHANDVICVSAIMIDLLMKGAPRPEDYPSMHAAYWASACPEWTWQRARDAFGITDVGTGYGLTECGSTATLIRPTDDPQMVERCHGRLKMAGSAAVVDQRDVLLEIKITNIDTKETLGPGEKGMIWLRGVTMTPGYYKEPEINETVIENGWFCTGDIGALDCDGYLTFLGRNNDTYKINGENVSPQFVESILCRDDKVNAIEVVGIDHPKCGAIGVAFVDTDENEAVVEQELRAYAKEHLASFQCPGCYIFLPIDEWPRTGTGKISKKELRKLAAEYLKYHPAAHH